MSTPSPSIPVIKQESDTLIIDGQTGEVLEGLETPPETPAPEAPPAPESQAGEGPAPEVPAPEAPVEEPTPTTITANRGGPCDWNIKPHEDGITAVNRNSNEVYEGSIKGFNEMLRG